MSTNEIKATNKDIIMKVMLQYDCQTAKSIAMDAKRLFQYDIKPAIVSGILRAMAKSGFVSLSKDGYGQTHYWLNDDFRAKLESGDCNK